MGSNPTPAARSLLEPGTAWLSAVGAYTDGAFVTFVHPLQSAEIRWRYTWGAQRGRKSEVTRGVDSTLPGRFG